MLKVYKVCQNQLAQLHPVHTSLCHPSWLDMNKKLDTSRVFKDWHNFCSFNSRLRQKKMRICNQFWPRFSLEVCWILRQVQGQYFQGQGMKFKEKLATMIQGIFKGNPWKFSIFKSTWSLIFDNQHPVFSCWDQWHRSSCHFHVCHTHVDVSDTKSLKMLPLKLNWILKIFKGYLSIFLES